LTTDALMLVWGLRHADAHARRSIELGLAPAGDAA
jgi:hypothetical protein